MSTPPAPARFQIRLTDIFVLLAFICVHLTIWGNPSELGLIITIIVSFSLCWLSILYVRHRFIGKRSNNFTLRLVITLLILCVPLHMLFALIHINRVKQLAAFHANQKQKVILAMYRSARAIRFFAHAEYLSTFKLVKQSEADLANAECNDPLHDAAKCQPCSGYLIKFLKGQGPGAKDGAKSYYKDGKQTEGFAFVFYPAQCSDSMRYSYITNHDGTVFEKDLGEGTFEEVSKMELFDPTGWDKVGWP